MGWKQEILLKPQHANWVHNGNSEGIDQSVYCLCLITPLSFTNTISEPLDSSPVLLVRRVGVQDDSKIILLISQ